MLGTNIKYYRLKNNLTLRELAKNINISPMALSYYENNKRRPNKNILNKIVSSLNVELSDLLTTYDTTSNNIIFEDYLYNHLTKLEKEYIDVQIIDYISRYYQILNLSSLANYFLIKKRENILELDKNITINSKKLRDYFSISTFGNIDLIDILEKNNIIMIPIRFNSNYIISTGKVNEIRYISYNLNLAKEIIYKHIVYLLIEIYFIESSKYNNRSFIKDIYLDFLLPKPDLSILIKNNKIFNSELENYQNLYSIPDNDFLYYLKKEKIFSGNIVRRTQKKMIEKSTRFSTILNQLYENNLISERKYSELKKQLW